MHPGCFRQQSPVSHHVPSLQPCFWICSMHTLPWVCCEAHTTHELYLNTSGQIWDFGMLWTLVFLLYKLLLIMRAGEKTQYFPAIIPQHVSNKNIFNYVMLKIFLKCWSSCWIQLPKNYHMNFGLGLGQTFQRLLTFVLHIYTKWHFQHWWL